MCYHILPLFTSSIYFKPIDRILSSSCFDIDHILSQLDNDSSRLPPTQTNQPNSSAPFSCPGSIFEWDLPSPFLSYPFSIHDKSSRFKPAYELISVHPQDSTLLVRSLDCFGKSHKSSVACSACQAMCHDVEAIKERASKPPFRLDRSVLTHNQILQKIGSIEKNLTKEKLAVCSSYFHCPSKHSNCYDSDLMLQRPFYGSEYKSKHGVSFLTLSAREISQACIVSSRMRKSVVGARENC